MRWFTVLFTALTAFALITTVFAIGQLTQLQPLLPPPPKGIPPSPSGQLYTLVGRISVFAAPISWAGVISLWIWRGHIKSRWRQAGYDKDAFKLMTQMKGATTRLKILESLDTPMDRLQLANKLGLDWKAIDRQTEILCRYGLVREQQAYGKLKIYSLSEGGKTMLKLIKELSTTNQAPEELSR